MTGVVSKHWNTKKPRQDVWVSFLLSTLKSKSKPVLTYFAWSRVNYSHSFPTKRNEIVVQLLKIYTNTWLKFLLVKKKSSNSSEKLNLLNFKGYILANLLISLIFNIFSIKKSPSALSGGGFELMSWRWLTLTWITPHYHQR